jgi:hypothetical protein
VLIYARSLKRACEKTMKPTANPLAVDFIWCCSASESYASYTGLQALFLGFHNSIQAVLPRIRHLQLKSSYATR